jgi:hypothetical protein
MAERSIPPYPGGDWRSWALQLVEYLRRDTPRQEEVLPRVIQLGFQIGGERASTDGLVMYSPTEGVPVYSKNGQWLRFDTNAPVLLREPR